MSKGIQIAKELTLPLDAVTQTFAEIARKGGGKTYLASMIAEGMLDAEAQVIVIDPVGNWWGLRVDADGKSKGKDIYVIGGEHGDVPLAAGAGREIAKILVESRISCVLDVSELRKHERKKFLTDFGEEFFHLKKSHRTPVHIFLEEAHTTIPQRVERDDARMVGAWEDIVRLGRNYGIGCSLISQRPQSINKEVLSQVECLCVLQTTGLHERKALEEWVQEAGADRKLVGELPGLERGEGYVWSPGWLKVFKRVHFLTKTTFDTSATPKLGEAIKAAKISKVDVEKLRNIMKDVVAKAAAESLKEKDLMAENKRLAAELAQIKKASAFPAKSAVKMPTVDPAVIAKAEQRGYDKGKFEASKELEKALKAERHGHKQTLISVRSAIKALNGALSAEQYLDTPLPEIKVAPPKRLFSMSLTKTPPNPHAVITKTLPVIDTNDAGLSNPQVKILQSIGKLHAVGIEAVPRQSAAALSGVRYTSGSFKNNLGALRTAGYVEYPTEGTLRLTDLGQGAVSIDAPGSDQELQDSWRAVMSNPQRALFDIILDAHPDALTRDDLAARAGVMTTSGSFKNNLGAMRTMGAIEYPTEKMVAASKFVFL